MFLRQGLDYGKKVKLVVNKMGLYNITGIDITMSRGERETYLEKDHGEKEKQSWVNELGCCKSGGKRQRGLGQECNSLKHLLEQKDIMMIKMGSWSTACLQVFH